LIWPSAVYRNRQRRPEDQYHHQEKNLMTSIYSRKYSFIGQASPIEVKLKNSDFNKKIGKKILNAFFSKHTFFKQRSRLLLDFLTD